jgi:hypothetical protein
MTAKRSAHSSELQRTVNVIDNDGLDNISERDSRLLQHFREKFRTCQNLNRQLVSFQANKDRRQYRWYKFKEAFSASLVESLFREYSIAAGKMLDPFAGCGTALFAASDLGLDADGVEVLPIGQELIQARLCLERDFTSQDYQTLLQWTRKTPWKMSEKQWVLPELRITRGAYPLKTTDSIERYVSALQHENERVRTVLLFALLCVLESISYTRKDGQYLRWDHRSGRSLSGKVFHKGQIASFDQAITTKLGEIMNDTILTKKLSSEGKKGHISLFSGSSLDILPILEEDCYDSIVTSPPYCNRYDYTRTYALELALLGVGERDIVNLRQQMLSCTVENREKDLVRMNPQWTKAIAVADNQELLQSILSYLERQKIQGKLNNNGIPRMVRGYFYEMACVLLECARVLKNNALMFMVNDNVRYAGASISVDMILSNIAEEVGFNVENILVLPNGKGNSSQQMGVHGREPLRKCVYVWRKE